MARSVEKTGKVRSARSSQAIPLLDRLWSLFASAKLALVLMLCLAVASFVGVMISQAPEGSEADPQVYARWLADMRIKFGPATDTLNTLGIFYVFRTWWFQLGVILLAVNIMVCTLHRSGPQLRSAVSRPRVVMPDSFYQRAKLRSSITVEGLPFEQVSTLVQKSLKSGRYRVVTQQEGQALHAFSDKNRFAPVGTLLHHAGMVILLLGFALGGMLGYADRSFIVAEGTARAMGNTGLTVYLDSFVDEYYPSGPPKDYRSNVSLYAGNTFIKDAVVRVNEPLIYNGTRLHQSFFGPAAVMEVRDADGTVLVGDTLPLAWRTGERPLGSFTIPSKQLEVFLVGPASAYVDPYINPGQMRLEVYPMGSNTPIAMENVTQGESRVIGDLTYTFVRERQFSGFSVVNDPGGIFLWAGAIVIVLGLMWVFYFPHQQFWARCKKEEDGTVTVQLGAATGKWAAFTKEFEKIGARINKTVEGAGGQATRTTGEV